MLVYEVCEYFGVPACGGLLAVGEVMVEVEVMVCLFMFPLRLFYVDIFSIVYLY